MASLTTPDSKEFQGVIPGTRVLGAHANGLPYFIRGEFGSTGRSLRGLTAQEASTQLDGALSRIAPLFRLNTSDLLPLRSRVDERGHTHVRYAQMKNGLPVVGQQLIVHVNEAGQVYSANGTARDGERIPTVAKVASEAAAQRAVLDTKGSQLVAESTRLVYFRPEAEGALQLAYEVVVTGHGQGLPLRDHVFLSAVDGSVIGRDSDIHSALNRAVYSANNSSSIPGTLKRAEGAAPSGDDHVDVNYDRLGDTYNCYKANFDRDSYDNAGALLKSSVHYVDPYDQGQGYTTNAGWSSSAAQMVYGDSNGVEAGPLGKSLDVTVHELTHAVTDSESDLIYSGESGALNEGLSDIFAAYCESWTKKGSEEGAVWPEDAPIWMIGDDIWTPGVEGDALRYMGNPTLDEYSTDYYPERYTGSGDSGGVHSNSGIANLAFKLLSTGGKHPRNKTSIDVVGIGIQKAGAIFYKANTDFMTPSTTFNQARTYTAEAAVALGHDGEAVKVAWNAVGVDGSGPPPPPPDCSTIVPLVNGEAVTGIGVGAGKWSCIYTLDVPANAINLQFDLSGGSGDADMHVKFGSAPTTSSYDCRPYKAGNVENCKFDKPKTGTYYVRINGYREALGMTLKASYIIGGGGPLANDVESSAYSGAPGSWTCFTLSVPSGTRSLSLHQTGLGNATGDADLYVNYGIRPMSNAFKCRPYQEGSTESCSIDKPQAGTWFACSYAYGGV
ncbi:MAG: M4 family metallopeptidase, partial [Cystobacter sp.]